MSALQWSINQFNKRVHAAQELWISRELLTNDGFRKKKSSQLARCFQPPAQNATRFSLYMLGKIKTRRSKPLTGFQRLKMELLVPFVTSRRGDFQNSVFFHARGSERKNLIESIYVLSLEEKSFQLKFVRRANSSFCCARRISTCIYSTSFFLVLVQQHFSSDRRHIGKM